MTEIEVNTQLVEGAVEAKSGRASKARKPVASTLADAAAAGIQAAARIEQIEARLRELDSISRQLKQSKRRYSAKNLAAWRSAKVHL